MRHSFLHRPNNSLVHAATSRTEYANKTTGRSAVQHCTAAHLCKTVYNWYSSVQPQRVDYSMRFYIPVQSSYDCT